jgi:transposase-like protein
MARFLVSEDEWERRRGVVARFAESGLSMAEFARREGVAYAALLAWRKRFEPPRRGEASVNHRDTDASASFSSDAAGASHSGRFARLIVAPSATVDEERSASTGSPDAATQRPSVEITMPSGVSIRLYTGADTALIRAAVEAVR